MPEKNSHLKQILGYYIRLTKRNSKVRTCNECLKFLRFDSYNILKKLANEKEREIF